MAGQATYDNMTHAYCMLIPKATNIISEYLKLVVDDNNSYMHPHQ
jgi:hypothetical protein